MEKIQQLSDLIDEVLVLIKKLDVKAMVFYDNPDIILPQLKSQFLKLNQINLFDIENEIWECNSEFNNESETIAFVNNYFVDLLLWKDGANTTEELMESIQNDISTLISRTYNTHVSPIQLSLIRKAYAQIAVKLLKFKFDYKEIANNFIKRVKLAETVVKNETLNSRYFSYKLDPAKVEEVALYLNAIIDKGYFLSVNPEKPYLKIDILNAISFLFSCKLNEMPANQSKQFNSKPSYYATNDIQNVEPNALSPFLMHTQNIKLARRIKEVFNIEKGKTIRLLLKVLAENDPPLIVIGSRGFKDVYVALKETFGRDIGTYQGILGYKYNEVADKQDYDAIQQKLNHILNEL